MVAYSPRGAYVRHMHGRVRAALVLTALSFSTFAFVTTETLPIGLLPLMAKDLGVSETNIGLLVTGYGAIVVFATIPLTRVTRRVPRRPLMAALLAIFVVVTCVSGLVDSYVLLAIARFVGALVQALFWAIVTPVAAALYPAPVRGRALAVLYAGSSLAPVIGIPLGTLIGQTAGWRLSFILLGVASIVALGVVTTLGADTPLEQQDASRALRPDLGRFVGMVSSTAFTVTGAFCAFTYITPFLTEVAHSPSSSVSLILFLRGVAGLGGVLVVGFVVDAHPWVAMVSVVSIQVIGLGGLWLFGANVWTATAFMAVAGFALSAISGVNGPRIMQISPANTAEGSAFVSTAFNVGITLGAAIGSLLVATYGVRSTALVGALLSVLGLIITGSEGGLSRLLSRRSLKDIKDTTNARAGLPL